MISLQKNYGTSSITRIVYSTLFTIFSLFLLTGSASASNNIEFLSKQLIKELNYGIYEVVTPKLESNTIKYARELPFDKLDFIERNEKYFSIGTAFFINDKEMMTASHVFDLSFFSLLQDFYIRDTDGNLFPVKDIIKYSTHRDMVVFTLKAYPKKIIPLTIDGKVEIGDTVFSVGNAQGEGIAYRAGQVASFTPEREYGKWKDIRFTSPASPGNSGGPLLNLQGKVVGLIVQKNQSENYNIGVPIEEVNNLTNAAEFHMKNVVVGLYGVDDTMTRDWNFSFALPAPVKKVASAAQNDLNNHWSTLSKDLSQKVADKNYPRGERFRDFLRNQPYTKGLAPLIPGTNFNSWNISRVYAKKIPLSASQNVYRSKIFFSDIQVIIEKPPEMSLKTFLDSPKIVMDNLLKAISFTRAIGTEKVPIISLGEPAKKEYITDKLGRRWISSLWDLPYSDSFVYSSCLPYPKGVICNIDTKQNGNRKYGYISSLHESYNEMTVGYEGEIKDWLEYFSLGKEYHPPIFQGVQLSFKENTLKLKLPEYSIEFSHDSAKESSQLHFHLGYSNEKLLAEDILRFEIIPTKGSKLYYKVRPMYEASIFNSDKYKTTWNSVENQSGDFSGKIVNEGKKRFILKTVDSTKRTVTNELGQSFDKVFTIECNYRSSDEKIEKDCEDFYNSVSFN